MKRRAISFLIALALCLSLCPIRVLADDSEYPKIVRVVPILDDIEDPTTEVITICKMYELNGHTYTVLSGSAAMSVQRSGGLYLTAGTIKYTGGSGIEVCDGGFLCVDDPGTTVIGSTYGLDIASGARVRLSAGTFEGDTAAILAADYSALLVSGYAYFDGDEKQIQLYDGFDKDGNPTQTAAVAGEKTVTVKACTNHSYIYKPDIYDPDTDSLITHSGICQYCGADTPESYQCTFSFNDTGYAKCDHCNHEIQITITTGPNLDYTGEGKTVSVAVTLDGNKTLDKGTDYNYTVEPSPKIISADDIVNADDYTVTVTGVTYVGTYTKTFSVTKAQPVITWNPPTSEFEKNYDGNPIDETDLLQVVEINNVYIGDQDTLRSSVQFSYKKTLDGNGAAVADTDFTDVRPTDAGTYLVKANLPETKNYEKASSDAIKLIIKKISPIKDNKFPEADTTLVYNGTAQELVTPGTVWDGAVILYATSKDGNEPDTSAYTESLPTGINAGKYYVWYKVEETNNYTEVGPKSIEVTITPKGITPVVELEYYTCVYDGGFKEPKVTVKDGETIVPVSEYTVTYSNNQNVGKAEVIISNNDGGNYTILTNEEGEEKDPKGFVVTFQITQKDQAGLTITGQPGVVTYGDQFTLGTNGGSGNGTVTWKIIDGEGKEIVNPTIAKIDKDSGQVTVTGVGTVTVQATRAGTDYKEATAEWTFTSVKKHVTATVTAKNKTYDGKDTATVTAVVEQGVVSGDTITITVTGTFSNGNAGTGKTVTVDAATITVNVNSSNATFDANEKYFVAKNYIITIPETTTADITKAAITVTAPTPIKPTYCGIDQALVTAGRVTGVSGDENPPSMEYSLYADGPWSATVPKGTDAGDYDVWYRVKEGDNYLGKAAEKVIATIQPKQVTASNNSNNITLTPAVGDAYYVYDGIEKKPAVTVTDTEINKEIPASEYTVTYSNNVNVGQSNGSNPPTVTVTDKAGGNYEVSGTVTFSITTGKAALTVTPKAVPGLTYNGNRQNLVTAGEVTGGHLEYAVKKENSEPTEADYSRTIPQGDVAGTYTVYYKVVGDDNHTGIDPTSMTVTIQPKTVVNPVITLGTFNATYDGQPKTPSVASVKDGDVTIPVTEYDVTYSNNTDAGTATVHITDNNGGNYTVNGSTTFTITKATAEFTTPPKFDVPTGQSALIYNGKAQTLITAGETTHGTVAYSQDGINFSLNIPTGTDAGDYNVWYKIIGDSNHTDSEPKKVENVKIDPKSVSPAVTLNEDSYVYDGLAKEPSVTVKDADDTIIPSSEYTVTYSNNVNVGTATVTVTDKDGGNYTFTNSPIKETFTIEKGNSAILISPPQAVANLTYSGTAQNLVTAGTATGGTVQYSSTETGNYSTTIPQKTNAGTYTVYYKVVGDENHTDIAPVSVSVTIQPKTVVNPVITLNLNTEDFNATYDGSPKTPGVASVKDGDEIITASEYTVSYSNNVNAGTATAYVNNVNGSNYIINGSKTFTITKATAKFTTNPQPNSVTYNGKAQTLIKAGVPDGGTAVYALDDQNGPYFETLPTGTDQGEYTVYAKVRGDANHVDSEVKEISVTIAKKQVTPTVTCSPSTFPYDGTEKTPNIIVTDSSGEKIPDSEYTVEFGEQPRVDVGIYNVTVKAKTGGNYKFDEQTETFKVVEASQAPLSIVTDMAPTVYYGDTFRLSAVGGSGTGAIQWSIAETAIATITQAGVVTVNGVGKFTVTAYREGTNGSYGESNKDSMTFEAKAKPVTAVVTAQDKEYDGNTTATLTVTVPGTGITINNVTGTFADANVGTNKTVTIDSSSASNGGPNYAITYPATTTASITPASTTLDGVTVNGMTNLTYSRTPQALITVSGTATGGDLAYSLDGRNYDLNIPTAINAGTYTVRYKILGDKNHTDSDAVTVTVMVGKAKPTDITPPTASSITVGQPLSASILTGGKAIFEGVEVPGTFTWTNSNTELDDVGKSQQKVTFTPADRVNFEPVTEIEVTIEVEVEAEPEPTPDPQPTEPEEPETPSTTPDNSTTTPPPSGSGTESASIQTTVRDGTASTVVSAAVGNQLANEAVANQSGNVVIKPEITGDVTKAEVSIPASAVGRIGNETDASLTVSTPIADVTIPNGALSALSGAGGTVSVAAEQVENTVVLTLTANGKDIRDIPGGLTLTVPTEDAGPGIVAVLIYEDGTREIIRKSVADDGGVRIPLNGSATVEIVDNSREFEDVPAENWAADAVAFASAHEMFNGTGETTFSPELSMSRAMLATVLYNLESNPDTAFSGAFADVEGGAWYAESVSWAADRGIVTGYGNGSFGANDSITREQLAVMLWRYAGSPTANEQALDFTDAGQASGYAMEALAWAAANGILNGYGDGRIDPTGLATRAQAAQMLKNFMENT